MAGGDDDLEVLRAAALLDPDGQERGQVVSDFHRRADRPAFEAACVMVRSGDMRERMIGLDVLGQFGYGAGRPFLEETLPIVIEAAFELAAPELLPVLRRLKQRETPDDDAETWKLDDAIVACSTAAHRSVGLDPKAC